MKQFILLTGASSGIGYAMAEELASKGYNLIIVARSVDKLEALKKHLESRYGSTVHTIAKDLSRVENATSLYEEIKKSGLEVTMLVNNAGVGMYGDFEEGSLTDELAMIQLNISSLVALTKLFLQDMRKRNSGRIMNIASLLSFLPLPYYAVYSATKAFVLSFSETLAAELKGTGITVTALCPGPTDTGFTTKEMLRTTALKISKPVPSEVVARKGVKLLLYGKGVKIVGFNVWFMAQLPRITPRALLFTITRKLTRPKRNKLKPV